MKLPSNFDLICAEATRLWGTEAQEAVAIGEIGELLTMFGRRAQKRDTPEQWVDEIADVLMMANQLAIIHGKDAVEERLAQKVEKLRFRLAKYGSTLTNQPLVPEDSTERLAVADALLLKLLPIVQCANDGRPFPSKIRGAELSELYAYLDMKKILDTNSPTKAEPS